DVMMAHIHLGKSGQSGPHVATLFHAMSPVTVSGNLASGTITSAQLEEDLAGHSLADLLTKMAAGDTYVNVHTKSHMDGEIRGQVKPIG
ncbi:MAG TPA: CHRD domain-containing protein, partial [Nitrolancea sp.]|nr:CHRD domain-containing protein [Nitrolancea sp.]